MTKNFFRNLIVFVFLILMLVTAQTTAKDLPRPFQVGVLDFLALDAQGKPIDATALPDIDLINLSKTLSLGVASKLVQYGEYRVLDSRMINEQLQVEKFPANTTPYQQAKILLENYPLDEVITGTINMLQTTIIIGIQRYQLIDNEVRLVGSAMESAPRISEAPGKIDSLLMNVYPADIQVVERPIEQIFIAPTHLRINLGATHQINVFALDALGRPVAQPSFLYIVGDETKVSVDEHGVVKGLQPGTTTVTVRGITGTVRSGPPATFTVVVVPPVLGVRLGTTFADGLNWRFGMRFTPSFEQTGAKKTVPQPELPEISDSSNPLAFISSFFSSLLTSGLITFDLDFDPNQELIFVVSGAQRSATGYLATGIGYTTSLKAEENSGFVFRFTIGTSFSGSNRLSIPAEAVIDVLFSDSIIGRPELRLGVNIGFDLSP